MFELRILVVDPKPKLQNLKAVIADIKNAILKIFFVQAVRFISKCTTLDIRFFLAENDVLTV